MENEENERIRDERGRFLPNHPPTSKGRKPLEKEKAYLASMQSIVTVDEWQEVTKTALALAKKGDVKAMKFIAEYIVPKQGNLHQLRMADIALLSIVLEKYEKAGISPSDLFMTLKEQVEQLTDGKG